MYRRIFVHAENGFCASMLSYDRSPMVRDSLGTTCIFSTIGDTLSKAYSATRDSVSEAAEKVAEKVSDAYDATAQTVSNAADIVADAYEATRDTVANVTEQVVDVVTDSASTAYEAVVDTISQTADTVADAASDAYDSTRDAVSSGFDASRDYLDDIVSGEKEINYWKVLGGAAVGVGAVAAAPFTGGGSLLGAASLAGSLAGAGTIAAAVGAGVAGAVVGANLGDDESVRQEGYNAGLKEGKAQNATEIDQLKKGLEKALGGLKGASEHFNAIIAMHAVAVAAANCDGHICESERECIEMFIAGLASSSFPDTVVEKITALYQAPPKLIEAFELAKASSVEMSIYDEIINLVIHADGAVHVQENAFMQAWNTLKVA
ncbi:hypothetical protein ACR96V_31670 [Pseudomonas aeruginosa]|uniref:hypothetical protein n=2 Tax=Pseudomonas aeruginosa TaxID=287 RepID=UPI000512A388|nr:hypothetical protein [Pseudomonas aeruginosa]MBX6190348.1 hypothetical protein [Pseudomonas aeruginosa]MBX6717022.1 hypothetical protein [Pseudomonas aeruginosa]MBX6872501.1 hypothetical protein [Pseudomonas aeruginosa]QKL12929.1 hypothetical protein GEV42_13070 [Pseudomonas aeruginosa]QQV93679.1 hypothetical protein HUF04_12925 [Pseudomonas aeruginosa]